MGTLTNTLAGRAKQVAGRATGNRRLARRGRRQVRRAKVRRVLGRVTVRRKSRARPKSASRPARVLALAPLARPVKVVRRTVTVEVYRPAVDDLEDEPSDRR